MRLDEISSFLTLRLNPFRRDACQQSPFVTKVEITKQAISTEIALAFILQLKTMMDNSELPQRSVVNVQFHSCQFYIIHIAKTTPRSPLTSKVPTPK